MSNNIKFSIPLSGLFKREVYTYAVRGLGGNWPAVVSPLSGSFEAKGKTETLNGMISFCPSTGLCPASNPSVLPYSLQTCGYENSHLYTNVAVDLTSTSDNVTTRSSSVLVECTGSCLPEVDIMFSGRNDYTLEGPGNNTYEFTSALSGLQANSTYDYSIISLGGNWPAVMLTPITGSFRPHHDTYTMDHKLKFCPSIALCPSSTRGYLSYSSGQCFSDNDLSMSIQLRVTPRSCNNEQFFSNQLTVYCKDCLPKPKLITPATIALSSPGNNITTFNSVVTGLIPGQTYNFSYTSINSTWPTVIVPATGNFTVSDDAYTLSTKAFFCPTTGLCPTSSTSGLMLPFRLYDTTNKLKKEMSDQLMMTDIRLNIASTTCDTKTYISEPIALRCNNCLPQVTFPNVEFDSSSLVLTTGCCSGVYPMSVTLSNILVGDSYRYSFTSSSPTKISFSPSTGIVSFGTTSSQRISTLLTKKLVNKDTVIVNVKVTHVDSGNSDTDFMTISCGSSTC